MRSFSGPPLPLEVRVLDDAEEIAERVAHAADLDPLADVLERRVRLGAGGEQALHRGAGVLNTPVGERPARAGAVLLDVGVEPQLKAADAEADVERLVEVR